jgi:pimeloyl-ACP methyl ester carboxylesterase
MMNEKALKSEKFIRLSDGRKLGYMEYGARSGFPMLALHGTPGSRIWFKDDDDTSKELGIRLITVDRPGYGISDEKKGRKISDFNHDIDQLVNHLDLNHFSIFGVSGGGPYALSYATMVNSKLFKVGMVASAYELNKGKLPKEMCLTNKFGFILSKYFPFILQFSYAQQKKILDSHPKLYIDSVQRQISHLCPSDQEVLKNEDACAAMALQMREAFRFSTKTPVYELRILQTKWEFEFLKIDTSVIVWHGENDTLSPISGLKDFIKRIPKCETHFLKGKGHFLDEDPEIWKCILNSLKP